MVTEIVVVGRPAMSGGRFSHSRRAAVSADEVAAVASARSTGDIVDFGESGETLKSPTRAFRFRRLGQAWFAAARKPAKCTRRALPRPVAR